jgi:excisionase family DNA binding protein
MKLAESAFLPPTIPSEEERSAARETSRLLAPHLNDRAGLRVRIGEPRGKSETALLPPTAVRLLVDLLSETAKGNAVTLIPIHAELTTQDAANLLNVSRPFVVQLIRKKQLRAHKVGTHRRIRFADLMAYKHSIDAERTEALDALAAQAQELNLGY